MDDIKNKNLNTIDMALLSAKRRNMLTVTECAQIMNVSRDTIQKIEKGDYPTVKYQTVESYLHVIGYTITCHTQSLDPVVEAWTDKSFKDWQAEQFNKMCKSLGIDAKNIPQNIFIGRGVNT